MKKSVVSHAAIGCAILIVLSSCSLFRKKIAPYPSGLIFPVEEASQIEYKGEINNPMNKRGTLVFISTRAGYLYCVDGSSQVIQWEVKLSQTLVSSPFLGEKNIYVLDGDNNLFCLSEEGTLLWQRIMEETITSGIIEFRDHVCMGTISGRFIAMELLKGERAWVFNAEDAIRSNLVDSNGKIFFGSDDGSLYVLSSAGHLIQKFIIGGKIGATLAVDGDYLYCGSGNKEILCFDVTKRKKKWTVRTGGELLVPPIFYERRGFFACMDNVLYCLDKKGGTILWWSVTPSRAFYHLMVVNEKIVVTSLSSLLMSFDVRTGQKIGEFQGSQEMRSNPVWCEPYVLVNRYDPESDKGTLLFFQKLVAVELSMSKTSPQKANEVIVFTATPFGFYLPEFEFFLIPLVKWPLNPSFFVLIGNEEEKKVVQEKSEEKTWEWFPENPGFYRIGVRATDEKETAETAVPFWIQKEAAVVALAVSENSPQQEGTEIGFTATSRGMTSPKYEFSLQRVYELAFFSHMSLFVPGGKRIVKEYSEQNNWTWVPMHEGLYVISVSADDGEETAHERLFYRITKKISKESEKKAEQKEK